MTGENSAPDACPSCGDSFVIPSAFLQHIYRQSVDINYDCQQCHKMLNFSNKCLLRIHILAHLEIDKEATAVSVHDIDVKPLMDGGTQLFPLTSEQLLASHRRTANETNFDVDKCMECLDAFDDRDAVTDHILGHPSDTTLATLDQSLTCNVCDKYFPSKCSLSAHKRLHAARSPYVCPECGVEFMTWATLKHHAIRTCFHEAKCVIFMCPR